MYEFLSLTAHYIDFSGFVANGLWDPGMYEFQKPFANYLTTTTPAPPPVLIDSSLKELVVLLNLLNSREETPIKLLYAFDASIKSTDSDPVQSLQKFSPKDLKSSFSDFFNQATINNPLFGLGLTIFEYILNIIYRKLTEYDTNNDRIGELLKILIQILKIEGIKIESRMEAYDVAYDVIQSGEDVELGKQLVKALWLVEQPSKTEQRRLLEKVDGNGDEEVLNFLIDEVGFYYNGELNNYPQRNYEI
tara:strand:- start:97 stop:840 length:744 start_codon:yes stop_codon:yes gene_type:complete